MELGKYLDELAAAYWAGGSALLRLLCFAFVVSIEVVCFRAVMVQRGHRNIPWGDKRNRWKVGAGLAFRNNSN